MTHIGVTKLTIIGSDNGLSPDRHQAIIWINARILFIWPLGTNFSEILIEIHTFSFKKMHVKMSSGKWRPFCLGLNVLIKHPSVHSIITFHDRFCIIFLILCVSEVIKNIRITISTVLETWSSHEFRKKTTDRCIYLEVWRFVALWVDHLKVNRKDS